MWQIGRCCYQRSQWVRPPDYNFTPGKITYLTSILVQNSIKLWDKKFWEKQCYILHLCCQIIKHVHSILTAKWDCYEYRYTMDRQWCHRERPLGKISTTFVRALHLERPLKPPFESLTVHSVGADSKIRNVVLYHLHTKYQMPVYFLSSHFWD